jgi:hypothetical protein
MSSEQNMNVTHINEKPIIICPNCDMPIIIEKLNCGIFRHGILKCNGKQIDPHSSKILCEYYIAKNMAYGCCKPFRISIYNGTYIAEVCDYI